MALRHLPRKLIVLQLAEVGIAFDQVTSPTSAQGISGDGEMQLVSLNKGAVRQATHPSTIRRRQSQSLSTIRSREHMCTPVAEVDI